MNKPRHDPSKFPEGNGRVGEKVLYITWRRGAEVLDKATWKCNGMKLRTAKITRVGLENQHGYFLNIEIQFDRNHHKQIVSALSTGFYQVSKANPVCLILPDKACVPAELALWAAENNAIVIRNPATEPMQFGLRCGKCLGEIVKRTAYVEVQDFRWWSDGFDLGKPEIVDGDGEGLKCDSCDADFTMPEDVEEYT